MVNITTTDDKNMIKSAGYDKIYGIIWPEIWLDIQESKKKENNSKYVS